MVPNFERVIGMEMRVFIRISVTYMTSDMESAGRADDEHDRCSDCVWVSQNNGTSLELDQLASYSWQAALVRSIDNGGGRPPHPVPLILSGVNERGNSITEAEATYACEKKTN